VKQAKKRPKKKAAKKKVRKKAKKRAAKKAKKTPARKHQNRLKRTSAAPAPRFVPEGCGSLLIVMSGPSGAGKSTLARRIAAAEGRIWRSVSVTTRAPRQGEIDGIDYLFATREEFQRAIDEGAMLEHATVHSEMYGTPREMVVERLLQGRDVLLEIDVQGAMAVREVASDAVLVFVVPPSREILERRLRERRSEDEDRIQQRLRRADEEVGLGDQYDYLVVNDDIESAVVDVLAIMSAERNRMQRRRGAIWWTR
jgi:guanylate kinase